MNYLFHSYGIIAKKIFNFIVYMYNTISNFYQHIILKYKAYAFIINSNLYKRNIKKIKKKSLNKYECRSVVLINDKKLYSFLFYIAIVLHNFIKTTLM